MGKRANTQTRMNLLEIIAKSEDRIEILSARGEDSNSRMYLFWGKQRDDAIKELQVLDNTNSIASVNRNLNPTPE
jgi:hypothetical protein